MAEPGEHAEPAIAVAGLGIIAWFVDNPVAANLLMLVLLVGGFVAGSGLNTQVFPTIDPRIISVTVPYPGATPSEVEEGITRRVEEAVFGIEGVDRVVSRAAENVGTVTIELKDFVDATRVRTDVETAVDGLADFPPEQAEEPDIKGAETVSEVMTLVVSSDGDEYDLRRGTGILQEALLTLPTVSLVTLQGSRNFEVAIQVSEETLRRYNLSIDDIARAVRASSLNLSAGELRTEAGDLLLRTNRKRQSGGEFADIVLRADNDGTLLRLGDVATIHDGFEDVDLFSEYQGRPSLFLKIEKSESEDTLVIAEQVRAFLAGYQPPQGLQVAVWNDQTEVLEARLNLLVRNGVLGFALVFLFLVLMLDLRLAIWVAMGVPISFLGAFLVFSLLGVTLNMVSLFGLIIVLGIVVDDAIVVGENIIAERERGVRGPAAAISGLAGVSGPVVVGALTTMAAFAPLLLATGTFGQILGVVPIVVIAVLGMSLLEAMLILPSHLSHAGSWSRGALASLQERMGTVVAGVRDRVVPLIRRAMARQYFTIFISAALLVLSLSLLATGAVRFIFFPSLEGDSLSADLQMPIGTPFTATRSAAEQLVAGAERVNERMGGNVFKGIAVTIGGRIVSGGGPGTRSGTTVSSNSASVRIRFASDAGRTLSAVALEKAWRDEVGVIPGVEDLSYSARFFGGGPDVEYELSHQDDAALSAAVDYLKELVARIPAVTEIGDTYQPGKRQYDITLTPAGEAAGLKAIDITRQLRQSFFGEEVQRIQRGRDELKVMVRFPRAGRSSTDDLHNVRIRLPDGSLAPLSAVAVLTENRAFSVIERIDGRRVVSVTGKVDTVVSTPNEANGQIQRESLPMVLQRFPGLQVREGSFGQQQTQDLVSLAGAMGIALLIIYAMLAAQLKSYVQPVIILSGVPFGAGGAIIGHYMLGFDLSFVSLFGIIALSGVVVNGALVMVDLYNQLRAAGESSVVEAVVIATQRRFRAIFLTTSTTALGLLPMLSETSVQAQFLIPMAVSLAIGILFAGVMVLLLVPALIVVVEEMRARAHRVLPSQQAAADAGGG